MEIIYRNVTNTYFDYRREIKKKRNRFKLSAYEQLNDVNDDDSGKENLLNRNKDIEMQEHSLLPPAWIEKVEECSEEIRNIRSKLVELEKKKKKKKLLNVLNDDQMIVEEIAEMCTEITLLIKNCESKIQGIAWDETEEGGEISNDLQNIDRSSEKLSLHTMQRNSNNIIAKLKMNAKKSLISQLKSISHTFHNRQKKYINDFKKLSNECNDYVENIEIGVIENSQQHELTYEENKDLTCLNIAKRNTDLRKISNTVIDLHHIFKELSVMLVDQGSMLDRIDYNLDLSIDKCEKGLNKLKIFQKKEDDKLAAKCVSFLTSLIFVLLVLIILKHSY
ncbi:t-SNARE [Plasmodium gonderi]|uniref:t-SNARE n=1 Tax=Plasmodium gonderi TaxID=77519 RepID=A0A1Y1JQL6_PLAGO|nr:t-SNARE [Plasmodium gonderi]GAW83795.1 t-SNARE [Plasmodium gonderi]